ncbi:hypothetical protein MNY64_18205 (plasmid) [Moellerella wisconsensis]|uniref:hypothetical protein n=1 Tax=Moellerella wisconsensis TaxID=158849 RepID=UPI001F4D5C80|nr:hypothetical protein [Moellerella wisconsensis]UNH29331.1 hypothetical protein MNY64_18205 [Moellerella wisconsensis]
MSRDNYQSELSSLQSDHYSGNVGFLEYSSRSSDLERRIRQFDDEKRVQGRIASEKAEQERKDKEDKLWQDLRIRENKAIQEQKRIQAIQRAEYEKFKLAQLEKAKTASSIILNEQKDINYEKVIERHLESVATKILAKNLILNEMLHYIENKLGKNVVLNEIKNAEKSSEINDKESLNNAMRDILLHQGKTTNVNI